MYTKKSPNQLVVQKDIIFKFSPPYKYFPNLDIPYFSEFPKQFFQIDERNVLDDRIILMSHILTDSVKFADQLEIDLKEEVKLSEFDQKCYLSDELITNDGTFPIHIFEQLQKEDDYCIKQADSKQFVKISKILFFEKKPRNLVVIPECLKIPLLM